MDSPGVERNRLLALLDAETRSRLEPALEVEPLHARQIVMRPDVPLDARLFPLDGALVADRLRRIRRRRRGRVPSDLKASWRCPSSSARGRCRSRPSCSCPGWPRPLPAERMIEEYDRRGSFANLVGRSMAALFFQTSQSVACNRLHSLQQRAARWLLAMADRYDGRDLPLTHEFLALMLGTSRPKVSTALGSLSRRHLSERTGQRPDPRPARSGAGRLRVLRDRPRRIGRLLGTPAG